jgi:hypothetical protein
MALLERAAPGKVELLDPGLNPESSFSVLG